MRKNKTGDLELKDGMNRQKIEFEEKGFSMGSRRRERDNTNNFFLY